MDRSELPSSSSASELVGVKLHHTTLMRYAIQKRPGNRALPLSDRICALQNPYIKAPARRPHGSRGEWMVTRFKAIPTITIPFHPLWQERKFGNEALRIDTYSFSSSLSSLLFGVGVIEHSLTLSIRFVGVCHRSIHHSPYLPILSIYKAIILCYLIAFIQLVLQVGDYIIDQAFSSLSIFYFEKKLFSAWTCLSAPVRHKACTLLYWLE